MDKIIELKEVANNYLADQEVVEREEIPSAKSTSELTSMTDVSTNLINEDTSQASDKTNEVEASNNQMVVQMTGGDGTKSYGFGLLAMNENEKKAEHHVIKTTLTQSSIKTFKIKRMNTLNYLYNNTGILLTQLAICFTTNFMTLTMMDCQRK